MPQAALRDSGYARQLVRKTGTLTRALVLCLHIGNSARAAPTITRMMQLIARPDCGLGDS
jgi:hypothetical protein